MKKELDDQVMAWLAPTDNPQRHSIAKETGVSYEWIRKFVRGEINNPGINTLRKIRKYFINTKRP